ncbi:MAG TPA: glycosyltransferase family 39 protein [Vicinamibacterales bacterium]|nr:glycosyltransferase family 39 protein [Vicinamibacterales bacterium]
MSSARVAGKWRAVALYTFLTLLLAYPLSLRPDRIAWANDPDGQLVMWLLAWDSHAFITNPLSIFDANTFYPERRTLAYQENLIGSAFFAAPILWITGNPVLAANFVSLLACVLCGLGAYVLARRVGIGETGALLSGVVFAFSPPRFLRFPQTHLAVVQWIPFTLASLHSYLESGQRRDLLLALAFFTLQVMSSGHAGVFLVVAIAVMLSYRAVLGEPLLLAKRVRDVGVAGVLLLVPAVLFMVPYRINQTEMGLRRSLGSWDTPLESFFASPTRVVMFIQSMITDRNINGAATAWLFPGFLPLALTLAAILGGATAILRTRARPRPAEAIRLHAVASERAYRLPIGMFALTAVAWLLTSASLIVLKAGDGLASESVADGSVVRTGFITVGETGLYNFGMTADELSRLTIDNLTIIDHGRLRPDAPRTGSIPLEAGSHRVLVESMDRRGSPPLQWTWALGRDNEDYRIVPQWVLSRRPVSHSTAVTARLVAGLRLTSLIASAAAALWGSWIFILSRRDAWTAWGAPFRSDPTALYFLLTAASVALALGPPYGLWQYVYWLPGFNFIRGSSRFMVLGLLGIAILAGIGFERLAALLKPGKRTVAAGIAVALMAAEFAAQPFSTPYQFEIPAADRWVAQQPKPFVVAELPSAGGYERFQTMYMLHSMAHWQKTIHGYGGIRPYVHSVLYEELDRFPDGRSLDHLTALGVTYLIIHTDMYPPEQWAGVSDRLASFADQLTLEYSDSVSKVYTLRRSRFATRFE